MPFPNFPRVVYEKNPLNQVICQLRFPPILRIDSDLPADFQERIRDEYPLFREQVVQPEGLPPEEALQLLPPAIRESLLATGKRAYDFTSDDEKWSVRLTRDFVALTCQEYTRWERFRSHLTTPLEALLEIYKPTFFSRIGLRYQNVIRKTSLKGLEDKEWNELLSPFIAAEFASKDISNNIQESGHVIVISLADGQSLVRIQHGLVKIEDGENEMAYLIDNDFFSQARTEAEIENVWTKLGYFKQRARRCFRWCISDELHNAMEPTEVREFNTRD